MQCQVLGIRLTQGGTRIAHVSIDGQMFGDLPCSENVQPGAGYIKSIMVVRAGRIEARLRVEQRKELS